MALRLACPPGDSALLTAPVAFHPLVGQSDLEYNLSVARLKRVLLRSFTRNGRNRAVLKLIREFLLPELTFGTRPVAVLTEQL